MRPEGCSRTEYVHLLSIMDVESKNPDSMSGMISAANTYDSEVSGAVKSVMQRYGT
jgi:hypothetical protein